MLNSFVNIEKYDDVRGTLETRANSHYKRSNIVKQIDCYHQKYRKPTSSISLRSFGSAIKIFVCENHAFMAFGALRMVSEPKIENTFWLRRIVEECVHYCLEFKNKKIELRVLKIHSLPEISPQNPQRFVQNFF